MRMRIPCRVRIAESTFERNVRQFGRLTRRLHRKCLHRNILNRCCPALSQALPDDVHNDASNREFLYHAAE
jgi:hypothetical protein